MNLEPILIFVFLFLYFLLLFRISYFFVGKGSDHKFYEYYSLLIKKNNNNFFSYYSNFLNKMPVVDPQFFFKLLSYLNKKQLNKTAYLLNPIVLTLLIVLCLLIFNKHLNSYYGLFFIALVALTPQYFHQQNSRIYGLSVRGVGLILGLLFLFFYFSFEFYNFNFTYLIITLFIGYLVWGTNLFAQQALVFFSILYSIFFGNIFMLLIVLFSFVIFCIIHRNFAKVFVKTRIDYGKIYYSILSKKFLFPYRYSIWRDWVYDFWINKKKSIKSRLSYVYTNSIFIVVFLNPLIMISIYSYYNPIVVENIYLNQLYLFSNKISFIGFVTFILISFRFSRFLGEPERYLEAVIPFSTFSSLVFLINTYDNYSVELILLYFLIINIFQISFFVFFRKFIKNDISVFSKKIKANIEDLRNNGTEIRFASNQCDWSKFLLNTEWKFVHFIPVTYYCGGVHLNDYIDNYPFMSSSSFDKICSEFNLNVLLIEKSAYSNHSRFLNNKRRYNLLMNEESFLLVKVNLIK